MLGGRCRAQCRGGLLEAALRRVWASGGKEGKERRVERAAFIVRRRASRSLACDGDRVFRWRPSSHSCKRAME